MAEKITRMPRVYGPEKHRMHAYLTPRTINYLNRRALQLGVSRSALVEMLAEADSARRLVGPTKVKPD
jgi:hypothetical protein